MKQILIALLTVMPLMASAQDNTWERVEVVEQPKENPDAKYLEPNAVPEVDGKVVFQTTLHAEGKTADEIYDILLKQLTKMTTEPNQIGGSVVVVNDRTKHELGAVFHEWLVFKDNTFSLDRTQMTYPGFHSRRRSRCHHQEHHLRLRPGSQAAALHRREMDQRQECREQEAHQTLPDIG